MRNVLLVLLVALLISLSAITALALTAVSPAAAAATMDSKPAALSLMDRIWLSAQSVVVKSVKKVVLVNRLTGKVEYVWSDVYKCYVRPKFGAPNIQKLYNTAQSKKR